MNRQSAMACYESWRHRCTLQLLVLVVLFAVCLANGFPTASAETVSVGGIKVGDLPETQSDQANALLASAIKAFESNDLKQCKADLASARGLSNDLPQIDVIMSRMHLSRRNVGAALALLEAHVVDHPRDADAYQSFGEIALASGRHTDAWLQFEHATALAKTATLSDTRRSFLTAQLTRLRALTAEKRKDYPSAVRLYRVLTTSSPNEIQLQWKLGQLLVASGDAKGGFDLLKRTYQKESKLPQPELMVATALVASNGQDPEPWYRKGVRAEDSTEQNLLEYARWLLRQDRLEYVSKMLAAAPRKWKSHRDVVFIAAIVDQSLGNMESAKSGLGNILEDDPNDLEASNQLALVLVESKDKADQLKAKQISESILKRTPKLPRAIATAAWIEFRLGSVDVADRMFKTLHKSGSVSPQTAFYIGRFLESQDQLQEAHAFYQLAVNSQAFFPQRRAAKTTLARKNEP